jgi:hypothetical protein
VNAGCIRVSTGAPAFMARYNRTMVTPIRLLGFALVIGLIAALCLLSAAGATVVAIATVVAVAVDTLRHRTPRSATQDRLRIDLSNR